MVFCNMQFLYPYFNVRLQLCSDWRSNQRESVTEKSTGSIYHRDTGIALCLNYGGQIRNTGITFLCDPSSVMEILENGAYVF